MGEGEVGAFRLLRLTARWLADFIRPAKARHVPRSYGNLGAGADRSNAHGRLFQGGLKEADQWPNPADRFFIRMVQV